MLAPLKDIVAQATPLPTNFLPAVPRLLLDSKGMTLFLSGSGTSGDNGTGGAVLLLLVLLDLSSYWGQHRVLLPMPTAILLLWM